MPMRVEPGSRRRAAVQFSPVAMTSNGSTDSFHLACPYSSLPICYCSHYIAPTPTYLQPPESLPQGSAAPPEDSASLLRGVMQSASAPRLPRAPPCPTAYELLVAQAAADEPAPAEDELAQVLSRAVHADAPAPVSPAAALAGSCSGAPSVYAPGSSPALLRTESMLALEWKHAQGLQADAVKAKKARAKPRRSTGSV